MWLSHSRIIFDGLAVSFFWFANILSTVEWNRWCSSSAFLAGCRPDRLALVDVIVWPRMWHSFCTSLCLLRRTVIVWSLLSNQSGVDGPALITQLVGCVTCNICFFWSSVSSIKDSICSMCPASKIKFLPGERDLILLSCSTASAFYGSQPRP